MAKAQRGAAPRAGLIKPAGSARAGNRAGRAIYATRSGGIRCMLGATRLWPAARPAARGHERPRRDPASRGGRSL